MSIFSLCEQFTGMATSNCNACCIGITLFTLTLIKFYFNGTNLKVDRNIKGEVIVITGANAGIGYETAKHMASKGATVILACRDAERGQKAADSIGKATQNKFVQFMKLDLSDLGSVRDFAKNFNEKFDRLNILINNAGVMGIKSRTLTKDGNEMQMGVNHYGHFLLTNLLLPKLEKAKESRVIVLSSTAHKDFSDFQLDNLDSEKKYHFMTTYGNSKQANLLFAKELQRRVNPNHIKVAALHPGVIRTELARNVLSNPIFNVVYVLVWPIYALFTKNTVQGSQTTLHCVFEDFENLMPGGYYSDCSLIQPSKISKDREVAKKLWEITEAKVGLKK